MMIEEQVLFVRRLGCDFDVANMGVKVAEERRRSVEARLERQGA